MVTAKFTRGWVKTPFSCLFPTSKTAPSSPLPRSLLVLSRLQLGQQGRAHFGLVYGRSLLGLLEDIDLGADLEGWAQLDIHGTHEMFFFK